ncbi:HET-domain-containing protein, partial [Saccharata proteae CBS 121410]
MLLCDSCGLPVTDFEAVISSSSGIPRQDGDSGIVSSDTRSSTSSEVYRYRHLPSPGDFRLLVLHAAESHEPLHCSIVHTNIDRSLPFEAVSYTWADASGNSEKRSMITCGRLRKPLYITTNCEMALRRFRLPNMKRLLWIDAICIDQESVEEHNHQVGIMDRIYTQAHRVLIHLGDAFDESNELFDFLKMSHELRWKARFDLLGRAVRLLLSRAWFTRVWVLQEAAMAKEALV